MDKNYWLAIAIMVGTIVGVGMFGLPYVTAQAGFLVGIFYLIIFSAVVATFHLIYGEIILRNQTEGRLVGFAEKYLGTWAKKILSVSMVFGLYGGQIAYILVGGKFLSDIFQFLNIELFYWQIIFFALGAAVVLSGLKMVAKAEFLISGFLVLVIVVFFLAGLPFIDIGNFSQINLKNFLMPYGVIMFSLAGSIAVPEIIRMLKGQNGKIMKAIILGTVVPAILYGLFIIATVGILGDAVSGEPIRDLVPYFGRVIPLVGTIFGFLACFTSYIIFGEGLKKLFQLDYGIEKSLSWALAMFVPLLGFFGFGLANFIPVISVVGAVFGGVDNTIMLLVFRRVKKLGDRQPEYSLNIPLAIIYLLIAILFLGALAQMIYFRL